MEGKAPKGGILLTLETWNRVPDQSLFPGGEAYKAKVKGYGDEIPAWRFSKAALARGTKGEAGRELM